MPAKSRSPNPIALWPTEIHKSLAVDARHIDFLCALTGAASDAGRPAIKEKKKQELDKQAWRIDQQ
jgi:hypothetical protein